MKYIISILFIYLFISTNSFSEAEKEDLFKDLPQSGVLSGSQSSLRGGSFDGVFGGADLEGKTANPISGSVSESDSTLIAKVFNNSDKKVRGSFLVIQKSKEGKLIKTDSFSSTLKPNGKFTRNFKKYPRTSSQILKIKSWKILD